MTHIKRMILLTTALIFAAGLAYLTLPNFDLLKMSIFILVCILAGEILCQIDKKFNKRT